MMVISIMLQTLGMVVAFMLLFVGLRVAIEKSTGHDIEEET